MEEVMLGDLNAAQIEHLLRSQVVGRIGCHAGGQTYIVPITYVYDGTYVYGHTGPGRKIEMMRANPDVCFEVDAVQDLANWQSVIAHGRYEELIGEASEAAMSLLINHLVPLMPSETSLPSHARATSTRYHAGMSNGHTIVYRIRLTEKTGRFEIR
jgi:uncharacterized protein